MRIGGLSEQNRQPAPQGKPKPNEDCFAISEEENVVVATVMDGSPVFRDKAGNYPFENGSVAATVAATIICGALRGHRIDQGGSARARRDLRCAFAMANFAIREENEKRGTYQKRAPEWFSAVGCAFWIDLKSMMACLGYIGDPLVFAVRPDSGIQLLTVDQMLPFSTHFALVHKVGDIHGSKFREYQDEHFRNRRRVECFCGTKLPGFGELTGEPEALPFVFLGLFAVSSGARFILATDAIEAIGAGNVEERKTGDYAGALLSLSANPAVAAQELLQLTRAAEQKKGYRSDDATCVIVDI